MERTSRNATRLNSLRVAVKSNDEGELADALFRAYKQLHLTI